MVWWSGVAYSHERGLGGRKCPSTVDKFRCRNARTGQAQRQELASEQTEDESLRPDAGESSPKGLEKRQRRIEPDFWSRYILRIQGLSGEIALIREL